MGRDHFHARIPVPDDYFSTICPKTGSRCVYSSYKHKRDPDWVWERYCGREGELIKDLEECPLEERASEESET